MAKAAIKDVVAKAEEASGASMGPEDPEAYAAEVAAKIKADVRCVLRYGRCYLYSARELTALLCMYAD